MTDEMLPSGRFAAPIRDGNTVTRRRGPGTANVHALLEHLAQHGFPLAPRALGTTSPPLSRPCRFHSYQPCPHARLTTS